MVRRSPEQPERYPNRAMSDSLALCYHALSHTWPAALAVTPPRFESQLERLVARGYRGATFSEVARGDVAGKTVAVTFDDAFASVLELAFPILSDLGLHATVFVPTDYPDSGRPMAWTGLDGWLVRHEAELRCMSWDELRVLRDAGWEIGSHTCSHPRLTTLDDAELRHELTHSRDVCAAQVGRPCTSLAYPYGDWDERVAHAARDAGYAAAGSLSGRFHRNAPLRFPRVGIYNGDDLQRFALKVTPITRRLRTSRTWGRIDTVRKHRRARRL